MSEKTTTQIEQPTKAAPEKKRADQIFVMPMSFRGGSKSQLLPPLQKPQSVPVPAAPVAPKPAPPAPQAKSVIKPKPSKRRRMLLIVTGVFVLTFVVVAAVLIFTQSPDAPVSEITKTQNRPNEATIPPIVKDEPSTKPPPVVDGSVFPSTQRPGLDSDSDGLTDVEERLIYATNSQLPDTDRDGFLDGNEVFHRYNPAALAPDTLEETRVIVPATITTESRGVWQLHYPAIWRADQQDARLQRLVATTGEEIQLQIIQKQEGQSLSAWFATLGSSKKVIPSVSKTGQELLRTEDQKTVYVDSGSTVIVFVYDPGAQPTLEYLQTFQMILNSLVLVPAL